MKKKLLDWAFWGWITLLAATFVYAILTAITKALE